MEVEFHFSLQSGQGKNVISRTSAFNLISLGVRPALLGTARQNGTCSPGGGCDGNTLYGDTQVLTANMDNMDNWTQVSIGDVHITIHNNNDLLILIVNI